MKFNPFDTILLFSTTELRSFLQTTLKNGQFYNIYENNQNINLRTEYRILSYNMFNLGVRYFAYLTLH